MIRRTLIVLLAAGSVGGLAAGCGGSSGGTSTSGAGTGTSGGGSSADVALCKSAISNSLSAHPGAPAGLKAQLDQLCNNVTSSNLKQVDRQICEKVVNAGLPSGTPAAIKNKALAGCKKA